MQNVKVVVVGEAGVGKTSLLITHTTGSFPDEYIPSHYDNLSSNIFVDGRSYTLGLWDTAGQEDYDRLRPLSYPQTDIFLICFAVDDQTSFQKVRERWVPELNHHSPGVPFILCGLKCDLRNELDSTLDAVSMDDANSMKFEIGAIRYIEISARNNSNVIQCFEDAARFGRGGHGGHGGGPVIVMDDGRNGGGGRRRRVRECRCPSIDWKEAANQSWQCFAFLIGVSLYVAVDVGALIVANTQLNTNDECWDRLDALWLHPATFLEVGALSSLIGVGLGMCFKTLCGVDESQQDAPRLCLLIFFMVWTIMGYVVTADIRAIPQCDGQGIGKMTVSWSVVKMIEACCGSMDIVINAVMFWSASR